MKTFMRFIEQPRVASSFWRMAELGEVAQWQKRGVEIAELRLDMWNMQTDASDANTTRQPCRIESAIAGLESYAPMPRIATARMQKEGGQWHGDEQTRADLLTSITTHCDAVDVELESAILPKVKTGMATNCALIVSRHNFDGADSLATINDAAKRAFDLGADIYKNASMVESDSDLQILKDFLQSWASYPLVIIGMGSGDIARQARLTLPALGSRLAFAAAMGESAPGQLSLDETVAAVKNR